MRLPVRESVRMPVKLHPLGRAVASVVRRDFINLAGVNQYFNIPDIVLSGDFTLTLKTTLPENGGYFLSDRYSGDAYQRLGITADGRLFGMLADESFGSATSRPDDVINTIVISRSGTTLSAYLNGVEIYSRQSARVFIINSIGAPYSGSMSIPHLDGIIASLRITGDNITSGGEPVDELFYPLDDSPDDFPVIRNSAVELGPEIWNYSVASDGSSARYANLGGVFLGGVETNTRYLVKIKMTGVTNGSCRLSLGSAAGGLIGADGEYNDVLDSGKYTQLYLQDVYGGFTAESVEISVKKAPGYGQFINGSVDAYGEFTEQPDGNWLGSGLSAPPWAYENQLIEVAA